MQQAGNEATSFDATYLSQCMYVCRLYVSEPPCLRNAIIVPPSTLHHILHFYEYQCGPQGPCAILEFNFMELVFHGKTKDVSYKSVIAIKVL